jgi:hypothetical protein
MLGYGVARLGRRLAQEVSDARLQNNALAKGRYALQVKDLMKPPRSKLRGITRKGIVCETPRFLTLFPLQGNLGASSEESPD